MHQGTFTMYTPTALFSLGFAVLIMSPIMASMPTTTPEPVTFHQTLEQTTKIISTMNAKEKTTFATRLGKSSKRELQTIIPLDKRIAATQAKSCCCVFWKNYITTSAVVLGHLALDIIRDLSDGRFDGRDPDGKTIDYQQHLVQLVHNAAVAYQEATKK